MMNHESTDDSFLQCDLTGDPVFEDCDGNKFYSGVVIGDKQVKLGDTIRVVLVDSNVDDGICQVLAIFDNIKDGDGVLIEVRWFKRPFELTERQLRV